MRSKIQRKYWGLYGKPGKLCEIVIKLRVWKQRAVTGMFPMSTLPAVKRKSPRQDLRLSSSEHTNSQEEVHYPSVEHSGRNWTERPSTKTLGVTSAIWKTPPQSSDQEHFNAGNGSIDQPEGGHGAELIYPWWLGSNSWEVKGRRWIEILFPIKECVIASIDGRAVVAASNRLKEE